MLDGSWKKCSRAEPRDGRFRWQGDEEFYGEPRVTTRCLADVTPEDVRWLWPGRFPLGKLSLLAGDPGLGKSFITLDAAARVTTGAAWPDGAAACPVGEVILLSAEDDAADTLVPRLRAHGADLRRVHTLDAVREGDRERSFSLALDAARLDAVLTERGGNVRLVVIDPISAYLSGLKDSHNNADVRGVLAPIAALAARHRCAVVCVTHLNKGGGANACYRATGSLAFAAAARAVWLVARDPADARRRLFLPVKANLAGDVGGLAYTIDAVPGRGPCVRWEADAVKMSADEFLALQQAAQAAASKRGRPAEAIDGAAAFLREALADGPRLARELLDEWVNRFDGSKATLTRAKQAVGAEAFRAEPTGPWSWRLGGDPGSPPETQNSPGETNFEHLGADKEKTVVLARDSKIKTPETNFELLGNGVPPAPPANGDWGEV